MTADRAICEFCAGDERIGDLTPIHLFINGVKHTFYFHNNEVPKNCLQLWLREQRARYNAPAN
ncbi:MAG TPA: hypothetical protein VKR52_04745 [Terracidiphilus sp.]|nr:hypothetical protein [Terracidiphilus sp.]